MRNEERDYQRQERDADIIVSVETAFSRHVFCVFAVSFVIASAAKQSRGGPLDCVVASLLAMTDGSTIPMALLSHNRAKFENGSDVGGTMTQEVRNFYAEIADQRREEESRELVSSRHVRIERIVSTGQATAQGEWLCAARAEWVVLLRGSAALRFDGEDAARVLTVGDYVGIPANCRHRVEWTDAAGPTVWLAVHYDG
jgi:cupin 2 domain-containing protein